MAMSASVANPLRAGQPDEQHHHAEVDEVSAVAAPVAADHADERPGHETPPRAWRTFDARARTRRATHAVTNTPAMTVAAAGGLSPQVGEEQQGDGDDRRGARPAPRSGAAAGRATPCATAISGPTPVRTSSAIPMGIATWS